MNLPVKSIAQAYTYHVPEELSHIGAGWRVFVPFGGRKMEGFVLAVKEQESSAIALKDILSTVDEEAWFTPKMIEAARWMSEFYLCSLAETMRLFMPGKSGLKITLRYMADETQAGHAILQMKQCERIYHHLLREGPKRSMDLKKAFPELAEQLDALLERMLKYHVLVREYDAEKRERIRYETYAVLLQPLTDETWAAFRRKKAQKKLLELLQQQGAQSVAALKEQGISHSVLHAVEEAGLIELRQRRILRDSYRDLRAEHSSMKPTEEQRNVLAVLLPALDTQQQRKFLLHGVTGSGKTLVYIKAAERAREKRRVVMVLVPEIALTGQLVHAFKAYFPTDIIVMHSQLSLSERNDAIVRIRRAEAGIIIGARSALFTPADHLGLIILDEEQDMSYKQDDAPRYHARVVAEEIARLHDAVLILGSATPSMETFFRAQSGEFIYLSMPERIGGRPLPSVGAVDMRSELQSGNRKVLSRAVQKMLRETKEKGEQAILLLNRRGYSTFVMCRSCGYSVVCPECGLSMAYHKDGRMLCHHCDIHQAPPDVCPKCGSTYIRYFGTGTEKLETELKEILPEVRVVRMDRDTTQKKFAHADILQAFRAGEYDILLGTQMVAKGHDIPNVTAVGIISADASLNMPDFRAAERCFMLITQAAGRAGRGDAPGRVLVQCYTPEHYAVHFAIAHDYRSFYEKELEMRRTLFFPPFCRLIKLTFHDENGEKARAEAEAFRRRFAAFFGGDERHRLIGPAPAVVEKFRGVYRFDVLIKTAVLPEVQEFLRQDGLHLRQDVWIDIDPISA